MGSTYTEWLENVVKTIFERKPFSIGFVARLPDGETLTAYYDASAEDKAVFSHHIQSDVVMDLIENNRDRIRNLLFEEYGEE